MAMFSTVLSSVLPVCLLVLLGNLLIRRQFLPGGFFAQLNKLAFWILLPSLLFCKIATAPETAGAIGLRIGSVLCGCAFAVSLISWGLARVLRLPDASARAFAQASMRGNLAYTALPILLHTLGPDSPSGAVAALALAPTIPFYNALAVLILGHKTAGPSPVHPQPLLRTLVRNPLIIGCLAGVCVLKLPLPLPRFAFQTLHTLGQAALPCALLALGAGFTPKACQASAWPALMATFLKLAGMPAIGFFMAKLAGLSGDALLITLLYLASPCAVTSYVMADQMGADRDLAASAIALSTVLCLPVMVAILLLFGQ